MPWRRLCDQVVLEGIASTIGNVNLNLFRDIFLRGRTRREEARRTYPFDAYLPFSALDSRGRLHSVGSALQTDEGIPPLRVVFVFGTSCGAHARVN